ncbi:MAG: DUF6166 domain-containing protein [Campylobacterota bacterium]|nr:DUF6166 domain-containing protein [Campylobacterota bacterium]
MKKRLNAITHLKYESNNMAINMNNHVFKGHRTLLGSKFVTYGEIELPQRYELFQKSSSGFDWGNGGTSSTQLAFSILYQLSNEELAREYATLFTNDVIKTLNSKDWIVSASDVLEWIDSNCKKKVEKEQEKTPKMKKLSPAKKAKKTKTNVVKEICKELDITQKNLAEILEVPEGTVSSWAVKNEIPRLGKKAIEFYILSVKNQKIVDSYRSFMQLLDAS